MGELTKSILRRIAEKMGKRFSVEPISPANREEFAPLVEKAVRTPKNQSLDRQTRHSRGMLSAGFNEATDDFVKPHPGKGGYLVLDEDKNVVGGSAFNSMTNPAGLEDDTLRTYFEELGAWPGELQYLSSLKPGVGSALFNLSRAKMLEQRPDIDMILMSLDLPKTLDFYDRMKMMPMEERMGDLKESRWWEPLSHMTHSLPPWQKSEYREGGPVEEKKPESPKERVPIRWAGLRG